MRWNCKEGYGCEVATTVHGPHAGREFCAPKGYSDVINGQWVVNNEYFPELLQYVQSHPDADLTEVAGVEVINALTKNPKWLKEQIELYGYGP